MSYPNVLLETPDSWGENLVGDGEAIDQLIKDLESDLGWEDLDQSDCEDFDYCGKFGKYGLYKRYVGSKNYEYRLARSIAGGYEWVKDLGVIFQVFAGSKSGAAKYFKDVL